MEGDAAKQNMSKIKHWLGRFYSAFQHGRQAMELWTNMVSPTHGSICWGSMVLMKNLSQNKYRRVINLISPPIEHDAYEANARNCEQISIVETSLVLPHSHFNQSNIFGYL